MTFVRNGLHIDKNVQKLMPLTKTKPTKVFGIENEEN